MADLNFTQMHEMQRALQAKYAGKWTPLSPSTARDSLLWSFEELGEVVAIIKKFGDNAIMEDETVRAHLTEELADVLMYLNDFMICYGITPAEIGGAYAAKNAHNMHRNYTADRDQKYSEGVSETP